MAVIKIVGYYGKSTPFVFSQITDISYQSDRYTPADILEFSALDDIKNIIFNKVEFFLDDRSIFLGIVDVQKKHGGDKGFYSNFVCRHIFCAMLDNEVKPYMYYNLSSDQLVKTHALPFAIKGHHFPYTAIANEIVAYKGISHWEFIELFCQLCYKKSPYVDREGFISLSTFNKTSHHFSNNKANSIRYSNVSITYDTYNIISKLYLKTGKDDIGATYYYSIANNFAAKFGINRTRYHNPSREWENSIDQNARYLLRNKNQDYLEIQLTVPDLLDIRVGDDAVFSDPIGEHRDLYVSQFRFKMNENGVESIIKLWDRKMVT